jgi:predicted double-glycine peptidase
MLDQALEIVSHLAGPALGISESFAYVQQEIDGGRPVGVRIQWKNDGDGHFVVLSGYGSLNDNEIVNVEDPWYGPSTYPISEFTSAYQSGAGQWNNTYPIA